MQCRIHPIIRRTATFGVALVLGMSVLAGTAAAAPAQKSEATTTTEDTDSNDNSTPNNVSDDADNRHPSGKDRSMEHGGSGNQGRAKHDPDDDGHGPDRTNGGLDQPDGAGGHDLADQDGNNGCGNDDDFEDDNEGWCGKPREPKGGKRAALSASAHSSPTPDTTPAVEGSDPTVTGGPGGGAVDVTGAAVAAGIAVAVPYSQHPPAGIVEEAQPATSRRPAEVLGVTMERSRAAESGQTAGAVLALTGFDLTTLILAAAALVLGGAGMRKLSRQHR